MRKNVSAHARALGKLGGSVKSKAKAAAARRNGKKGGAPKGNKNACKNESQFIQRPLGYSDQLRIVCNSRLKIIENII